MSILYQATHILNSPLDIYVKRQKVLCLTFYKTNTYSHNALRFTKEKIKF